MTGSRLDIPTWRKALTSLLRGGATLRPLSAAVLLAGLLGVVFLPAASQAQDQLKIAAIVNEEPVTELDVFMRVKLAMMSAGLQDSPESRQRLLPAVMRTLIDEHLKLQEAKRQNIVVAPSEIEDRIDSLASRNNMSRAEFESMLSDNGVMIDALSAQITAEVSWVALIQRRIRPRINIDDQTIDDAISQIRAARGKTEYLISTLFLAVDTANESAVLDSAQRILEQARQGTDFASLARTLSEDRLADRGGDHGWTLPGQLDPEVAAALPGLTPGQISEPIRGTGGYYLVLVRDTRVASGEIGNADSVTMSEILWPMPGNAADTEVRRATTAANEMATKIGSCQGLADIVRAEPQATYEDLGEVLVDRLPDEIKTYAINQPVGQATPPVRTPGGLAIYVVCGRAGGDSGTPSRIAIADRLGQERMEALARGYLSDLRRAAFIDIRL